MVRRLRPRPHGLHRRGRRARLRALARQRRAASRTSRSGSSPATTRCSARKTTDATGTSRFDPGLARGEGGMAPGIVVARRERRLRLPRPRHSRLRSHRSRRQGPRRARAGRAFLYTERGVYRTGETVCADGAAARRARARAVAGPASDARRAPAGRRRISPRRGARTRASAGAPCRSRSCPAPLRGTWRVAAYTRSEGRRRSARRRFLVEDYVPERLELTLTPKAPALRPGEPAEIDVVRALSLRRAGRRSRRLRRGRRRPRRPASGIKGLDGFTVGLDDETVEASTDRDRGQGDDRCAGSGDACRCRCRRFAAPRPTEARIVVARRPRQAGAPSSAA